MKKEMRKCAVCGKKFMPKAVNSTVCSEKCRKALRAKRDKARKAAIKDSPKEANKIAPKAVAKPAAKKPVKKVVKAVCKEKVVLPKKMTRITVKEISPDKMLAFAIFAFIKSLKELSK